MPSSKSYNAHTIHRDLDAELDRLRKQATAGWHREAELLERPSVAGSREVLEIGCGPGFITQQLLALATSSGSIRSWPISIRS